MAHPYTLQAVSYGFDSLFMDVILTYTISAALLVNQGRGWRLVGADFLLQLLLLNLYQPGANGFLVMTGCFSVASALGLLESCRPVFPLRLHLLISAVIYAGGYGIHRLLIALFFEHRLNGYALNSANLTPFDSASLLTVIGFAFETFEQLVEDFGQWPVVLPFLVLAFS